MNRDQLIISILKKRIAETVKAAKGKVDDKYITLVMRGVEKLDEVINVMKTQMQEGKFLCACVECNAAAAGLFPLVLAWLHLWSLTITTPKRTAILGDAKGEERQKIFSENSEAAYYGAECFIAVLHRIRVSKYSVESNASWATRRLQLKQCRKILQGHSKSSVR